jgi:hypothetical protein
MEEAELNSLFADGRVQLHQHCYLPEADVPAPDRVFRHQ